MTKQHTPLETRLRRLVRDLAIASEELRNLQKISELGEGEFELESAPAFVAYLDLLEQAYRYGAKPGE